MANAFSEWAMSYWARGFSPIPILAGGKAPGVDGHLLPQWQQYCTDAADKGQLAEWARDKAAGLAVCTGYRGLIAIDVDSPKANAAAKAVLGGLGAPVKIGRRGCTAFFWDPTETIRSVDFRAAPVILDKKRSQETLLQILARGRQTILPPTVHPETGYPYYWKHGNLEDYRIQDLPVIAPSHVEALAEELKPLMPEAEPPSGPNKFTPSAVLTPLDRKRYDGMARGLLRWVRDDLSAREPGGRSRAVYGIAQTFGPFIREGFVAEWDVRAALVDASNKNGLEKTNGKRDVLRNIRRGFEAGKTDPLPLLKNEGFSRP